VRHCAGAGALYGARQVWRLLTAQLHFTTLAEALVGGLLLYRFRVLERLMG